MENFLTQRLSYEDKIKDDYGWAKKCIKHFTYSVLDSDLTTKRDKSEFERKLSNYELYNNILNQADFERECNPLGINVGQFKDEIQPYNKIYNKVQVLLGEELSRPFKFRAFLLNEDGIKSKLAYQNDLLKKYVMFKLQKYFPAEERQQEPPLDPDQVKRYMSTTYQEAREIAANKILTYLKQRLDLKTLKGDGFKHALISGEEHLWIGGDAQEPVLKVINPLSVFYHKSPDTKYVQDSLYAGTKQYLNPSEVLDRFGRFLTQEDIDKIENYQTYGYEERFADMMLGNNPPGQYSQNHSSSIRVVHLEWKSYRKVGFLETLDPQTGEKTETLVSEEFKVPLQAEKVKVAGKYNSTKTYFTWDTSSLYWDWIPEVWEGVMIGDDIYAMMGPKDIQFRSEDNPYDVKLGYHGLIYSNTNAPSVSLVDRMKPFQYLYFVIVHKMKKLIAQDKGKILHFDTSMIDPKIGLEKSMYYIAQLGIDFFNPLQNSHEAGAHQRGKVTTATDASTAQLINNYMQLLIAVDEQISDTAGVTRQREGQISNSEAVGNAQQNIQQSSTITELYFYAHEKLWEQALNSLIQVAQTLYKEKSIIKQYILDDLTLGTLELTPESLTNADLGVFIGNSQKEEAVFKALQDIAMSYANSGKIKVTDLIKMIRSDSIEELERDLKLSEENTQAQMQQQGQQQSDAQMQIAQEANKLKWDMQTRELENKLETAKIDSLKFVQDNDINDNQIPDSLEIAKFMHEVKKSDAELALQKEKNDIDRIKAKSKPAKA